MLKTGGKAILSECYVRKISKMPVDLWRFTYDGTKELFSRLSFDDSKAMISLIREKDDRLLPLLILFHRFFRKSIVMKSTLGYMMRRIHRKYLSKGIFGLSRLLPEITIYSIAAKTKYEQIK